MLKDVLVLYMKKIVVIFNMMFWYLMFFCLKFGEEKQDVEVTSDDNSRETALIRGFSAPSG